MRRFTIPVLFLLALASVALAATLAEVTADADALLLVYEDLEDRVDACPGGTCQGAQAILDDLADAEVDRAQLHTDRDTLDPCTTCSSVDVTIGDIDSRSGQITEETGNWDQD